MNTYNEERQAILKKIKELSNEIETLNNKLNDLEIKENTENGIMYVSAFALDDGGNGDEGIELMFYEKDLKQVQELIKAFSEANIKFYIYELDGKHSERIYYFTEDEFKFSYGKKDYFTETFNYDFFYKLSEIEEIFGKYKDIISKLEELNKNTY